MNRSRSDSKTLSCFFHEETSHKSPTVLHFPHQQLARRSLDTMLSRNTLFHDIISSPESLLQPPGSPASTWSFSPPCTPSNPLLHQCLSSLHRDGNIHSVVVSKGLVLTGSSSACIRAWRPLTSSESGCIQASSGEVRAMLAHGDLLFTSHKDHRIRVWNIDTSTGEKCISRKITTLPKPSPLRFLIPKASSQPHKDTISCMAYNHAEGLLYTGSWDKTVKAWRLSDRKCIDSFVAHADNINDMVINRDGYLFTCSSDGSVKMWSQVCGETFHTLTMTLSFLPFPIYALALSEVPESEQSFLYSGSSDGCINFWERKFSGGYSHGGSIHAHRYAVLCLKVLDDLVISGSADSTIKIWKREDGKVYHCLALLDGHRGPVKCLAACIETDTSEKGFLVFSASLDHTFKVWKVKFSPGVKKTYFDDSGDDDNLNHRKLGREVSPVLSPSWVKKVQLGRLGLSD